jgi:hypothetical protein
MLQHVFDQTEANLVQLCASAETTQDQLALQDALAGLRRMSLSAQCAASPPSSPLSREHSAGNRISSLKRRKTTFHELRPDTNMGHADPKSVINTGFRSLSREDTMRMVLKTRAVVETMAAGDRSAGCVSDEESPNPHGREKEEGIGRGNSSGNSLLDKLHVGGVALMDHEKLQKACMAVERSTLDSLALEAGALCRRCRSWLALLSFDTLPPSAPILHVWSILCGLLVLYSAVALPARAAFQTTPHNAMVVMDCICEVLHWSSASAVHHSYAAARGTEAGLRL